MLSVVTTTMETTEHSNLKELTDEFNRTGRIRIETVEGDAWLVEAYDLANDIKSGAVYSKVEWPYFVKLDPEHKLQIHQFLCGLGGGRLERIEFENDNEEPSEPGQ